MSNHERLLAATATEREALLGLPFIQDGARGHLSLGDYVAFLGQAYHHVKHTLPLLMACGSRIPERLEWLREAMSEYIDEETGHQEWILNDINACGFDAEAVRKAEPSVEVELMVAYAYDLIHRRDPVAFLGMVLVLEGTSVRVATQAAEALTQSLGLSRKAFTYLNSHGSLDQDHVVFFESLVDRLGEQDLPVVIHAAKVFYQLYGNIFRALDARRISHKEAA